MFGTNAAKACVQLQSDPELLTRTEAELQRLQADLEQLRVQAQPHACDGDAQTA